jgi:acetyl esterase/lipase
MRKIALIILFCILSGSVSCSDFWSHNLEIHTDLPYGDHPAQIVDVYSIAQPTDRPGLLRATPRQRPTLVWFHGGAWLYGDKSTSVPNVFHYLENGWNVVNVNYRLGPGTAPQAVDDAMCAYKWAVDRALALGNSKRFVVSGSSAGGHLALAVGLLNSSGDHVCRAGIAPAAVVNWFGITDIAMLEEYLAAELPQQNYALIWIGDENRIAEISDNYSPVSLITDSSPPIISIHGTDDVVVPYSQAKALHARLRTRNKLVTMQDGAHGGFTDQQMQEALTAVFRFLKETLE